MKLPFVKNDGMTLEVANLPPSPITIYASFLVTNGLRWLAKSDEGKKISDNFAKQLEAKLNKRDLRSYGFTSLHFGLQDPKKLQGKSLEIKAIIRGEVANDVDVSPEELKFIRFAVSFMENPYKPGAVEKARVFAAKVAPSFMRNFDKVVSKLGNNNLGSASATSKGSVKELYADLEDAYGKLTGKKPGKNLNIPIATLSAIRSKSSNMEAEVKRYKAIKRKISLSYDLDLAAFMSTQNGPVQVATAYKHMSSLGYRNHKLVNLPEKAPLMVDVKSGKIQYLTNDGLPLSSGIPSDATIQFSSKYNKDDGTGAYLTFKTPNANGVTRLYTEKHVAQATNKKFNTATKINKSIDGILKKWEKGLVNRDPLVRMASTASMLIYITGARVGARQNSAASMSGEKTFGIVSLRPAHVTLKANNIRLKYKGKKGGLQEHNIPVKDNTTKKLLKNLKELKEGKKGDTLLFSLEGKNGRNVVLNYTSLNKFLKSTGYVGGAHKMRHVRGTNLLIEKLNENKNWSPSAKAKNIAKKQKEADEFIINKVITPVTRLLGHKSGTGKDLWRTTIKSYINPEPLISWYSSQGLRKPGWLPAKATN